MAGKIFTFDVKGDIKPLLEKARVEAAANKVLFVGDEKSGTFTGTASGSYVVEAGKICITVDSAPWYAPWSMVKSKLEAFFV